VEQGLRNGQMSVRVSIHLAAQVGRPCVYPSGRSGRFAAMGPASRKSIDSVGRRAPQQHCAQQGRARWPNAGSAMLSADVGS